MEKLNELLNEYSKKVEKLMEKAKPGDGLLGMGQAPQYDACHDWLDEQVALLAEEIQANERASFVDILLHAEKKTEIASCGKWMLIAIQRHALPLLDELSSETAKALYAWYENAYPANERLPIQKQIVKKLKKRM